MVSEINQASDAEVQAHRDAGDSGNSVVPSDPPSAGPPNSLLQAKSLPSPLPSDNRASVVRSTAPRPTSSFLRPIKSIFGKWTGRNVQTSVTGGEIDQPLVTTADKTEEKLHFRWTYPYVDPEKVYGFKEELQVLESFVRKENDRGFRAVAVVGAGGIGKTTLCQLLFNEKGIEEEFAPRIWVTDSILPTTDLKAGIVRRMLMQIGEDETEDMELDRLMALLHRNLWGKKYLIVLDDASYDNGWYYNLGAEPNMEDEWKNRFAYGLPKGSGGRVVVTGRNEEVARKMVGEHNLHKVMPLSNEEYCWSIFEESVGPPLDNVVKNNGMSEEAMKKKVYEKSGGRPLAVMIMGQIMKEQLDEMTRDIINRTATI